VSFKVDAGNDPGMVLCSGALGRAVRLLAVPVLIVTPWRAVRGGDPRVSLIGGDEMNAVKIAAIVLILAGVLGLVYGSFSYTKETHEAKLGPIEMSVKEKQTVNVPVWAGVGAMVIGGVLLLFGSKKS
jgi:drug/metabolite transporter (DMT)-like permease